MDWVLQMLGDIVTRKSFQVWCCGLSPHLVQWMGVRHNLLRIDALLDSLVHGDAVVQRVRGRRTENLLLFLLMDLLFERIFFGALLLADWDLRWCHIWLYWRQYLFALLLMLRWPICIRDAFIWLVIWYHVVDLFLDGVLIRDLWLTTCELLLEKSELLYVVFIILHHFPDGGWVCLIIKIVHELLLFNRVQKLVLDLSWGLWLLLLIPLLLAYTSFITREAREMIRVDHNFPFAILKNLVSIILPTTQSVLSLAHTFIWCDVSDRIPIPIFRSDSLPLLLIIILKIPEHFLLFVENVLAHTLDLSALQNLKIVFNITWAIMRIFKQIRHFFSDPFYLIVLSRKLMPLSLMESFGLLARSAWWLRLNKFYWLF